MSRRCENFTEWFISSPYGGHWYLCTEHKDVVVAANKGLAEGSEASPIKNHMSHLTTYVGERENRHRCCWDEDKHASFRAPRTPAVAS